MYKILVAEDDISIADLERDYLEVNGYQVVIKQEGSEVMQELRTNDYAAILIDIMLPGKMDLNYAGKSEKNWIYQF